MERETDPQKTCIGKTVLVVDDSAGFETCIEAENGKEAIDVAKQSKFDLIILDLSMPLMNGLQSAPELRKISPQAPIILFTLYGRNLAQTEPSKAGINLVVDKSVPLSTLIEKAHELMTN